MSLKEEIKRTTEGIKFVFDNWKYKLCSMIVGLSIFGFLYYFLVADVAEQSIWTSVMMSGPVFVTLSIVFILLTSILSGILFSMIFFQFNNFKKSEKRGFFGFVGSGFAAFGVGCPTCGAFLFGLVGLPLALTYFPFKGLEIQLLGIVVLLFSIYMTGKSIHGKCSL